MMNAQNIDIQMLLPQKPPMVMVDKLISADEKSATTALLIREENIFVSEGYLNAYALIEVMAQTCAAQLGYADHLVGNHDVRIGYVGSVKRMHIDAVPKVGETLLTRMEVLEDFGDMKLVSAESFVNDQKIATAELTIALSGERISA